MAPGGGDAAVSWSAACSVVPKSCCRFNDGKFREIYNEKETNIFGVNIQRSNGVAGGYKVREWGSEERQREETTSLLLVPAHLSISMSKTI